MADVHTPEQRSRNMAAIRGGDTKPEMRVRALLHALGYRFRLHRKDLPGKPDIVLPKYRTVIFVHGCFWHAHKGCKYARVPATRPDFWIAKLQANVERDQLAIEKLAAMGWRVLSVWECAIRNHETVISLSANLIDWINGDAHFGEISGPPTS